MENRNWRLGLLLLIALGITVLSGCNGSDKEGGSEKQKLTITGSSTVAPLILEIAKRYESLHPGVRIDVQTGGSSRGIRDALEGLADIGMASRNLKPEDGALQVFPLAFDGICVIVHKDNPVTELSHEQVRGIYQGNITNWSEVGGLDRSIVVVNKAEGRSTLELFLAFYGMKNTDIKAHVIIGDNEQGVKTVLGNPDAIGYVSIGTAEYNREAGAELKLLPVDGVAALRAHVADGTFPLSRSLNLVTAREPEGLTKAFLAFATSAAVHDLVEELYFVPINE